MVTQISFRLIPRVLDTIDGSVLVRKEFAAIHSIVIKLRHIREMITTIIVSIGDSVMQHVFADDRQSSLSLSIKNHADVDLTSSLKSAQDGYSGGSSAPILAFASSRNVELIHFNGFRKRPSFFNLMCKGQTKLLVEVNRCSTVEITQIFSRLNRYAYSQAKCSKSRCDK